MSDAIYLERVEETLNALEELLDDAESDLDYDNNGAMMTIKCTDRSQIILTRQPPVKQLWLATRTQGLHFDYDEAQQAWVLDSDGSLLRTHLMAAFADQTDEQLDLSDI
ncbi:iron donor protein CyaY [Marinobacterium sp. xm-d-564]|uniref:iron donor protein CyaY n=1 Tax=Marinobacterium sp. xm-d-564 TaxID=2497742 RepID=UPI0015693397|nr:iron donor protein CyaY [Marinobacterium sp. xm-d-564]NRP59767.1 frataxin-like protein [Marinobacterium sp. xm-d-564]